MREKRLIEVPFPLAVVVSALLLAFVAGTAFLTRMIWLPLVGAVDGTPAPPRDPAAVRAEEIAVAVTSVDYRDAAGFLARLRPLASERAYEQVRIAFVGLAWAGFERQELVITEEQVTATDQGQAGLGEVWQARRVHVLVVDMPDGQAAERDLIVQLVEHDGVWLLQNLLSEEQLRMLMSLPTGTSAEPTAIAIPSVEWPAPSADEDPASFVALEFARAYVAVDYRAEGIWLERLRSLTSPESYAFLQSVVHPQLWEIAEAMQLVIPYEEVVVEDEGVASQGETALERWQVRRVALTYSASGLEGPLTDAFLVRICRPIDAAHNDPFAGWRASGIESERGGAGGGG